jgi:hypothetical protein
MSWSSPADHALEHNDEQRQARDDPVPFAMAQIGLHA